MAEAVAAMREEAGEQYEWDANRPIFTAECHQEYTEGVLDFYNLSVLNVNHHSADNTSCNKLCATHCGVAMVGCYSHRLHLAVSLYVNQYKPIKEKVRRVMNALAESKNIQVFRQQQARPRDPTDRVPPKEPLKMYDNRWYGVFQSFQRYRDIYKYLPPDAPYKANVHDNVLNAAELASLNVVTGDMAEFDGYSKKLQSRDLTLAQARIYFDDIKKWLTVDLPNHADPALRREPLSPEIRRQFLDYIEPDSDFVHSSEFESAVVKIQMNREPLLSGNEKLAIHSFLKPPEHAQTAAAPTFIGTTSLNAPTRSRADRADDEYNALKRQRTNDSAYLPMEHVRATTNPVERGFSRCSLIKSDLRGRMFPINLEIVLFLYLNRDLWSIETLQECKTRFTADTSTYPQNAV